MGFLQEKKTDSEPFKHVFKWAKKNDVDIQLVRDIIKKKGRTKFSSPRVRFRSPRLSDRI